MKKWKYLFLGTVFFGITTLIVVRFYSYIFAKTVNGTVIAIERVNQNTSVITSGRVIPSDQLFSFAVALKSASGEITTGSTEDRQWAVVVKDQCAEAKFFPYPPWDLDKAGTYFGVRLIRMYACP